jgi:hypothetical protein
LGGQGQGSAVLPRRRRAIIAKDDEVTCINRVGKPNTLEIVPLLERNIRGTGTVLRS